MMVLLKGELDNPTAPRCRLEALTRNRFILVSTGELTTGTDKPEKRENG